ncbi:MAG: ATP synthase subunit I [Methylotenera sp.]
MENITTASIFSKMLRLQLMATGFVAIISLVTSGLHAGISALAGGVAVILGAFIAAKIAQRSEQQNHASAVLINLLKAEATKILVIFIVLLVVFKLYKQLVPFALIAGLAAAALVSGAAMSKLDKTGIEI